MDRTAYFLYRVAGEEFAAHGKSGHVAGTAGFNVPIPRNLASIFLVQHRIKNGLLGQTGREFAEVAGRDQLQLFRADRAIQDCCFCVHSSVYVLLYTSCSTCTPYQTEGHEFGDGGGAPYFRPPPPTP